VQLINSIGLTSEVGDDRGPDHVERVKGLNIFYSFFCHIIVLKLTQRCSQKVLTSLLSSRLGWVRISSCFFLWRSVLGASPLLSSWIVLIRLVMLYVTSCNHRLFEIPDEQHCIRRTMAQDAAFYSEAPSPGASQSFGMARSLLHGPSSLSMGREGSSQDLQGTPRQHCRFYRTGHAGNL